jgi:hypothetical protein
MHATHNAVIQNFFDHITAPKAHTAWFVGEFGCALLLPIGLMAWYSWRDLRSVEARRAAEPAVPDRRAASVAPRTISIYEKSPMHSWRNSLSPRTTYGRPTGYVN